MTDIRKAVQWGTSVAAGVLILVLYRSEALAVQRASYVVTVGCWIATVGLLAWRNPRPWQRQALATVIGVVTLGATAAVTLAVPADQQHTTANWAVGANGWLLLTISSGGRVTLLLLALTGQVLFAMGAAIPAGPGEIVLFAARALGILGLQLPIALAAQAIERSAETTRQLQLTREALRTEQLVAAALHDDRLGRSRLVAAAVEPVLAGLASAEPDDALRQRSAIAAAQVRRLLAEWHGGVPLGDDLSACLDAVQAAGTRVEVAVHTDGLPPELRRVACEVLQEIARLRAARVRVTAVPGRTHLILSVVAQVSEPGARLITADVPAPLAIRTTTAGETLWVELTCPV